MRESSPVKQQAMLLLLALAIVAVPLAATALWLRGKHMRAAEELAALEPRFARVLGMREQQAEIREAIEQIQAIRARHVYPAENDSTQTGNAMLQQLRSVMDRAGLSVSSSQVRATADEGAYERITISLTADGTWAAIQEALIALRAVEPTIFIDDLQINLKGSLQNMNPKVAPDLSAQFTISILRGKAA